VTPGCLELAGGGGLMAVDLTGISPVSPVDVFILCFLKYTKKRSAEVNMIKIKLSMNQINPTYLFFFNLEVVLGLMMTLNE